MLRLIWRRIIWVCAALAAVLGFFAFIEFVRAYQVLNELHPWLGVAYLCVLALILMVLVIVYIRSVMTRRTILRPPDRTDRRRYAEYLMKLARRLDGNDGAPQQGSLPREYSPAAFLIPAGTHRSCPRRC